jgi:hypothetical protein
VRRNGLLFPYVDVWARLVERRQGFGELLLRYGDSFLALEATLPQSDSVFQCWGPGERLIFLFLEILRLARGEASKKGKRPPRI